MDETYHLTAIVLNREDFRENDSRVIVFTKEKGKLELIARGTKKIKSKLASHLEPLNLVEIMAVRGRNFDYVGSVLSQECFFDIKNDLDKLDLMIRSVSVFTEAVKYDDEFDSSELYNLLNNYLVKLNKTKKTEEIFYYIFLLRLMMRLGYSPVTSECAVCGRIPDEEILFNNVCGGLICGNCASKNFGSIKISPKALSSINFLKDCNTFDLAMPNETDQDEFVKVISGYCSFMFEKQVHKI